VAGHSRRAACTPSWSPAHGITVGHNTGSLLMRRAGLLARSRGTRTRRPITITELVHRDFHRNGPNQLWVTDITEHPTREEKVYLSVT
jgi:putative transposase